MTGKTHVAIGMSAALTMSIGRPIEDQLLLVLASIIGSLVPDLDHPKGKLNQRLLLANNNIYRILFYISLGAVFMYLFFRTKNQVLGLLSIMSVLIGISSHRSFTHSIVGFMISASIVTIATLDFGLSAVYHGFIIGYILHLVADFFTPKGIKLFYPLKANVVSPMTVKTNGIHEKIIFASLSMLSVGLLLRFLKI